MLDREISRRALLRSASWVAAGSALGLRAASAQTGPLILGTGSHRYECIHEWLTPPAGMRFGDTHGVAQDGRGRIYVAHTVHPESTSSDAIAVFDEKGKFLKSWGAEFRGGAHGLDLRREGRQEFLYHCDTNRRLVVKTDLDGKVIWEKGAPEESGKYKDGAPFIPTNVAFAPNGDFYVADGYGSNWIHRYNIKGEYLKTFGGTGSEPGKVSSPHGLWVDGRGKEPLLTVADRSNRRIQVFDLDGKHVKFIAEGMRLPCHFSIRRDLMVVPDLQSVVTLLDAENKVVASLGDGDPTNLRGATRDKFIPGKFIHPHDTMFLRNGDLLVAEWVPIGRVTLLKKVR